MKVRALVVTAIELIDPRKDLARQASQATGLRIL